MWCENIWEVSDFVDWAALIGINAATLLYVVLVTPFCRPFDWNDATINYPNSPNTFPVYSLAIMLVGALLFHTFFVKWMIHPLQRLVFRVNNHASYHPVNVTTINNNNINNNNNSNNNNNNIMNTSISLNDANHNVNVPTSVLAVSSPLILSRSFNEVESQFHAVYVWWRAQLWAFTIQFALTSFMKVYVGRLRPDYLARLASKGITQDSVEKHHYPDPHNNPNFYCELSFEHPMLYDGRLAFPSGHSSCSFAICTLLSLFFIAHLRPFANQGSFARLLISLSPLSVSFICALSRTRDYKHGFSDVIAGSLLGIVSAMIAFHMCIREVNDKKNVYVIRADSDSEEHEQEQQELYNYNTTTTTTATNSNNNKKMNSNMVEMNTVNKVNHNNNITNISSGRVNKVNNNNNKNQLVLRESTEMKNNNNRYNKYQNTSGNNNDSNININYINNKVNEANTKKNVNIDNNVTSLFDGKKDQHQQTNDKSVLFEHTYGTYHSNNWNSNFTKNQNNEECDNTYVHHWLPESATFSEKYSNYKTVNVINDLNNNIEVAVP